MRTVNRRKIVHCPVDRGSSAELPEYCYSLVVQHDPDHLKIRLKRSYENHRKHARVDQLYRKSPACAADSAVRQRDLDSCTLDKDNKEKYGDRCYERKDSGGYQNIDEIGWQSDLREIRPSWDKPDRESLVHLPVDYTGYELLGDACNDEKPDAGPNAPFGDDLIHEQDKNPADADLYE